MRKSRGGSLWAVKKLAKAKQPAKQESIWEFGDSHRPNVAL
jgi:hypothetical protein